MIPVLGVAHYNRPDLTARCLRSIDYPVGKLVLITQGPEDPLDGETELTKALAAMDRKMVPNIALSRHQNHGVAGAWNEIIVEHPAEWWTIVNNDIQFTPGDLETMSNVALAEHTTAAKIFGNHGASWFVITRLGVDTVGLFDQNFHPAYMEDCDWFYRAKLMKARMTHAQSVGAIHGIGPMTGSCTIQSDAEANTKNGITYQRNEAYYQRKWGGKNGHEKFLTPFNDPQWPVWAWKFESAQRGLHQW